MEKTEVFSNEALVNDVVMGLHQSFGETNSYRGRYIAYFESIATVKFGTIRVKKELSLIKKEPW